MNIPLHVDSVFLCNNKGYLVWGGLVEKRVHVMPIKWSEILVYAAKSQVCLLVPPDKQGVFKNYGGPHLCGDYTMPRNRG